MENGLLVWMWQRGEAGGITSSLLQTSLEGAENENSAYSTLAVGSGLGHEGMAAAGGSGVSP